ncbi:MAG: hypothetical protein JW892_09930, partial [Anaerolineae bacterium]|nr:hypothetical protein [Anaerolineae bacterium]
LRPQKSRSRREAQRVFLSDLADFATVVFLVGGRSPPTKKHSQNHAFRRKSRIKMNLRTDS